MKARAGSGLVAGALARLAGGRPQVVVPLARAMDRAARGQIELLREKSGRRHRLSAAHARLVLLGMVAFGSLILSLFMLTNQTDMHPPVGVILLVSFHWLLVLNMVVAQAGPALLVDEDSLVLGAWPVTRREIVLARLVTVLREAFEVTIAVGAMPLATYLWTGRPFGLPALALAAGLVLQTLGVAFGVTTVLMLLVRTMGRTRAERLAALVADGNFPFLLFLLVMFMDRIVNFLQAHPDALLFLPPAWFAAWGDLAAGPRYWALAGAGAAVSLLMIVASVRMLRPQAGVGGERAASSAGRPSRWHPASLIAGVLRPAMPGREGAVLRRLLEAHLREDWRFIAGMVSLPVIIGVMFFVARPGIDPATESDALRASILRAVPNSHLMFVLAMQMIFVASYSSRPKALWIVALGDLDGGRLLAAQRGMIRGLLTLPVCLLFGARALVLGAPVLTILRDLAVLALQMELIVILLQRWRRIMPFSLAYTRDHSARRVLQVFFYLALAVGFTLLNYLYAGLAPVRWTLWTALPVLVVAAHVVVGRQLAGTRLDMSVVVS